MPSLGYCDWFDPKRYRLGPPAGHIEGYVGFVNGSQATQIRFQLVVPGTYRSLEGIDWESLLDSFDSNGSVEVEPSRLIINCVSTLEQFL